MTIRPRRNPSRGLIGYGRPGRAWRRGEPPGGLLVTLGIQDFLTGRNKISANVDIWSPTAKGLNSEYSLKIQTWFQF